MKMKILAVLLGVLSFASVGCTAIKHKLDGISDDQLAAYLEEGAQFATSKGISMATKKWPDRAAQIKTDAIAIDKAIREVVIPAFSGEPTAQVLTQILAQITAKVRNTTLDTFELVFEGVLLQVPLPPNPTDKLSPRTTKGIIGFFTGSAEGIEKAEGLPNPTPAPVPPPPPPAPAPGPTPAPPPK